MEKDENTESGKDRKSKAYIEKTAELARLSTQRQEDEEDDAIIQDDEYVMNSPVDIRPVHCSDEASTDEKKRVTSWMKRKQGRLQVES